jgi:hypothetical protein
MKRIILTALLVFFYVNVAQAACDNKSLKGSYTVVARGFSNGKHCGTVGVAIFDGKGKMELHQIEGCEGIPTPIDDTFTYKIDTASCMGNILSLVSGGSAYFVFNKALTSGTILSSGNSLLLLSTLNKQ